MSRYVTADELAVILRHLDLKVAPRAAAAATLGSRRDDHVEASRTIVWDETQDANGDFLMTYDEYA
jgi:hypothetical protein